MSRIGKKPVAIPQGVMVEIKEGTVFVEGPKGKISRKMPDRIKFEIKDNQVWVTRVADTKMDRSLHGLCRVLVFNMIKGVLDGYVKELEIIGVGYKVQVQGPKLTMQLGYSHPVVFTAPEGIKIEAPKPTHIIIRGIDKEKVGGLAAEIRLSCPPEPYKGKGIRYLGEHIKKKVGKAQASGSGAK